jgi:hypothetical protein
MTSNTQNIEKSTDMEKQRYATVVENSGNWLAEEK